MPRTGGKPGSRKAGKPAADKAGPLKKLTARITADRDIRLYAQQVAQRRTRDECVNEAIEQWLSRFKGDRSARAIAAEARESAGEEDAGVVRPLSDRATDDGRP